VLDLAEDFVVNQVSNHPVAWALVIILTIIVLRLSWAWLKKNYEGWQKKANQLDRWNEAICGFDEDGKQRIVSHGDLRTLGCEQRDILLRVENILRERQKYFDKSMSHHEQESAGLKELNEVVRDLYVRMDSFIAEAEEVRLETQIRIGEMKDAVQRQSADQLGLIRALIDKLGNGRSGNGISTEQSGPKKK